MDISSQIQVMNLFWTNFNATKMLYFSYCAGQGGKESADNAVRFKGGLFYGNIFMTRGAGPAAAACKKRAISIFYGFFIKLLRSSWPSYDNLGIYPISRQS